MGAQLIIHAMESILISIGKIDPKVYINFFTGIYNRGKNLLRVVPQYSAKFAYLQESVYTVGGHIDSILPHIEDTA